MPSLKRVEVYSTDNTMDEFVARIVEAGVENLPDGLEIYGNGTGKTV